MIIIAADDGAVFSDEYVQQDPAESGRPTPWFYRDDADAIQPTNHNVDAFIRLTWPQEQDTLEESEYFARLTEGSRNVRTDMKRYNREWVTMCSSECYHLFGESGTLNNFGTPVPIGDHGQSNWEQDIVGCPIQELDLDEAHYHWRYHSSHRYLGAEIERSSRVPYPQGVLYASRSGSALVYPEAPWIPYTANRIGLDWRIQPPFAVNRAPYWLEGMIPHYAGYAFGPGNRISFIASLRNHFRNTGREVDYFHPRNAIRNTKTMLYLVNTPEARTVNFGLRLQYIWSIDVQHSVYNWTYDPTAAAGSQWTRGARHEVSSHRRVADAYAYDPAHHPGSPRVRTLPAGNIRIFSIPLSKLLP